MKTHLSAYSWHNRTMTKLNNVALSNNIWIKKNPHLFGLSLLAAITLASTFVPELFKLLILQPVGMVAKGSLGIVRNLTKKATAQKTYEALPGAEDWKKSMAKISKLCAGEAFLLLTSVGSLVSTKPAQLSAKFQSQHGLYHQDSSSLVITAKSTPPSVDPEALKIADLATKEAAAQKLAEELQAKLEAVRIAKEQVAQKETQLNAKASELAAKDTADKRAAADLQAKLEAVRIANEQVTQKEAQLNAKASELAAKDTADKRAAVDLQAKLEAVRIEKEQVAQKETQLNAKASELAVKNTANKKTAEDLKILYEKMQTIKSTTDNNLKIAIEKLAQVEEMNQTAENAKAAARKIFEQIETQQAEKAELARENQQTKETLAQHKITAQLIIDKLQEELKLLKAQNGLTTTTTSTTTATENLADSNTWNLIAKNDDAIEISESLKEKEEPFSLKESFCQKYAVHTKYASQSQIAQYIEIGRNELHNIVSDNADQNKLIADYKQLSEENFQEKMCGIIWYLMYQAAKKNQDFEEGAFSISDPGHKIAHVFTAMKDVYPNSCYERRSSHLKGFITQPHLGINISKWDLPYTKTHVLFIAYQSGVGEEKSERLYLKPENYGMSTYVDKLGHTVEYLHSVGRKVGPQYFGSDDAEEYKKERIPLEYLEKFKDLVPAQDHEAIKQAKIYGIAYMLPYCQNKMIELDPSSEAYKKFEKLENTFKKYDALPHRIGREVQIEIAAALDQSVIIPIVK